MSSDGKEVNESDDSANLLGDVYIGGARVDVAFAANAGSEIVAVDTGCNCIVLINPPVPSEAITYTEAKPNSWIGTATTDGKLIIDGEGTIESDDGDVMVYRHCSEASANLMPTIAITQSGARISIFFDRLLRKERMIIKCNYEEDSKRIECSRFKGIFWIEIDEFYDILYRGGWTVDERAALDEKYKNSDSASLSSSNAFSADTEASEDGAEAEVNGSDLESLSDYRLHMSELELCSERLSKAQEKVGLHRSERLDARNVDGFLNRSNHPLAKSLKKFNERCENRTLRTKRELSPIAPKLREDYERFYLMGDAVEAPALHANVAVRNVARKSNDSESFYLSLFFSDLSEKLDDSKLVDSESLALLGSSTTNDLLTLMHNRIATSRH
jgi:hypothetical protein